MRIRAWALIREKQYSQGYLDYIHKYIVLSTHKKPRNSLVSVLFGQSRDLKGLVLITLLLFIFGEICLRDANGWLKVCMYED